MSAVHLIHRAEQAINTAFVKKTGDTGLTPRQYAILDAVSEKGGTSQAALATATGIDRSTLADIMRRLVARKLLARKRSRGDARAYEVTLTEAGRKILEHGKKAAAEVDKAILAALGTEAKATSFLASLAKVVERT